MNKVNILRKLLYPQVPGTERILIICCL